MRAVRNFWITLTLALLALFTTITLPAYAQATAAGKTAPVRKQAQPSNERILNYDINAVLDKDGKMTVTERLTVNVENRKIRHGITRTYPIAMRQGQDNLYKFTFDVISTKLDGQPVQNKIDKDKMIVGMALGDAKTFVSKGIHTYEIIYVTDGHVRQFEKFDGIYYNAVGLDVIFPIDKATFSLTLPDGTKPLFTKAYTGKRGEKGADYRMTGDMSFETTRGFNPNEAFTVIVCWKKGVVIPTHEQAWVSTHRTETLAIIVVAVILVLAIMWFCYFRKNTPPTYPIFTPPADLSPGKAAYVDNGGNYVPLMLQVDLMWSAIQGFCKFDFSKKDAPAFIFNTVNCPFCDGPLENQDQKYCPHCLRDLTGAIKEQPKRKKKPGNSVISRITYALFEAATRIILGTEDKSNDPHSSLVSAWKNLYKYYTPKLHKLTTDRYMPAVWGWLVGQCGMAFVLGDIWYPSNYGTVHMLGIALMGFGFAAFCIFVACGAWTGLGGVFWRFGITATGFILSGISLWVTWDFFGHDIILMGTFFLLYALPIAFFWKWHAVPSKEAIEELKTTEGIKMYINTAEKRRLEIINAPEDTIEHYEAILPYAIALGCAEAWEKRFAPVLSQLNYMPSWISGNSYGDRPEDYETWEERQRRRYEEQLRRQMFAAVISMPVSVEHAAKQAIAEASQTRSSISGGGGGWFSGGGSSGSSGSSGGGSGGGGVGGW